MECTIIMHIKIFMIGKNLVSLILDSPKGIDKCKRKLPFVEDDEVAKQQKQQKPRKKKWKLVKVR